MKTSQLILGTAAALSVSTPALAHNGEHSFSFVASIMHWLSSPTHSLFAVIGGLAISALIFKASKRKV